MYQLMRLMAGLGLWLIVFTSTASAEVVDGRVAQTNRNTVDLVVYDAQGKPYPNKLHLKVDSRTRMYGFSFSGKPEKQDFVRAEISQERPGLWRADALNLLGRSSSVAPQPAKPVSQTIMEAFRSPTGQKIARGGLTGAITGATASAASGGKAVKGALIGAGLGAVGEFVADLFGQRQSTGAAPSPTYTQDSGTTYKN